MIRIGLFLAVGCPILLNPRVSQRMKTNFLQPGHPFSAIRLLPLLMLAACQAPLTDSAINADLNARLQTLSTETAPDHHAAKLPAAPATVVIDQKVDGDYRKHAVVSVFLSPLRDKAPLHCTIRFGNESGKQGPAALVGGYVQAQALKKTLIDPCQEVSVRHDDTLAPGKLAIAVTTTP